MFYSLYCVLISISTWRYV